MGDYQEEQGNQTYTAGGLMKANFSFNQTTIPKFEFEGTPEDIAKAIREMMPELFQPIRYAGSGEPTDISNLIQKTTRMTQED